MIYLILDTNIWLYLANSQDPNNIKIHEEDLHFKIYDSLSLLVEEGRIELLTNEIVMDEWRKNIDHSKTLIKKFQDKLANDLDTLKRIKKSLEGQLEKEVDKIISTYTNKIKIKIHENEQHIRKVEKLLNRSRLVAVTGDVKIQATDWAIAKKAPFHGSKQFSIQDALILFSAVRYMTDHRYFDLDGNPKYPLSIFVSANKNDFSDPRKPSEVHADLLPVLNGVNMLFFISLPLAINQIHSVIASVGSFQDDEIDLINQNVDQYLYEIQLCSDCYPDAQYQGLNKIEFEEPEDVVDTTIEYRDPNQLTLPFFDELKIPEKEIKYTVQRGTCSWCGMEHLKCKCGCVSPFEAGVERIECPDCGLIYARAEVPFGFYDSRSGFQIVDTLEEEKEAHDVDDDEEEDMADEYLSLF